MVRSIDDELIHRSALRMKYLEDPGYRRWSDIVPGGISESKNPSHYRDWRDDVLFMYFISGQVKHRPNVSDMVGYLDSGRELPINWNNFYAYFDERLNDPENRYKASIIDDDIRGSGSISNTSVRELLDMYRSELIIDFDIV